MKYGSLHEITSQARTGRIVVPQVKQTTRMLERMRGLLGRPPLEPGEGLLIRPCNSVHTLCMRYPIDVIFLDRTNTVLKLVPALRPFRLSLGLGSVAVLELGTHEAQRCGIEVGMRLGWEDICKAG